MKSMDDKEPLTGQQHIATMMDTHAPIFSSILFALFLAIFHGRLVMYVGDTDTDSEHSHTPACLRSSSRFDCSSALYWGSAACRGLRPCLWYKTTDIKKLAEYIYPTSGKT
jgi:hypothetical protein